GAVTLPPLRIQTGPPCNGWGMGHSELGSRTSIEPPKSKVGWPLVMGDPRVTPVVTAILSESATVHWEAPAISVSRVWRPPASNAATGVVIVLPPLTARNRPVN